MYKDILEKLIQARLKLPLKTLMEKLGRGPSNQNWKSFPTCPYCEGRKTAGVFSGPHGELFKCHSPSCRSMTAGPRAAWDEIGFLAFELGCDRRDATRVWLEEAGLWEDCLAKTLASNSASTKHPARPSSEDASSDTTESTTDPEESPVSVTAKSPLIVFYEALELLYVDREELQTKRGLSDEAIDAAGYRTNGRANLELLHSLIKDFSEAELVRCGLWSNKEKHRKPNAQYYGFGVLGKKKKLSPELLDSGDYNGLDDDDLIWDWKESGNCNPILIPYYDVDGNLIGLRPHKGFPSGQPPRLYLAGGRTAVKHCKRAVITEGEFKADALQSTLGPSWAVAAVPGITMIKNLDVWGDLLIWLQRLGAEEVVFVFDNEEQADPALPYYKPHLEDRFAAEVWARVGAIRLDKEGYQARVAHLPDEWRNEQGKVDWDSALAAFLKQGKSRPEIAALFEAVLEQAQTPAALAVARFHGDEAERSIGNRVAVRAYEPALPWGGAAERRLAKHLRRLANTILPEWKARILMLAEAYERTDGWYYELKISELQSEKLKNELHQPTNSQEQIKFLKLAMKGMPSRVASFRLVPCYVLVKPDGTRVRLVKLRNIRGEYTELIALDSKSLTATREFRLWLSDQGNFGWESGERPLQALQRDLNYALAYRDVIQLVCYGCERVNGLWFTDDCVFAPDGTQILPDPDGIFWHRGKGYKFLRNPEDIPVCEEEQEFRMKALPRMWPDLGLGFDAKDALCLNPNTPDDPVALPELLGNFVLNLNASYGGHDGAMLIGGTTAFFAGPDLFAEYNQFPGLWITGEKDSGKTYTARWLMGLHGATGIPSGLSFKTSTAVGMQIALGQLGNIPLWADEFRESELRDDSVVGVVHGGFNREVASKWAADGRIRTIRTSLLITGESSCVNAATMSRFITVIAAKEKRQGTLAEQRERLAWLQHHQRFFFIIGRMILRNRAKFVASVKQHLQNWQESSELVMVDPRARFTFGVSYASFMALNELIPVYDAKRCIEFRLGLIQKTIAAATEQASRTDVVRFFQILISALQTNVFGRTASEIRRYFKWVLNPKSNPPLSAQQLQDGAEHPYLTWKSGILYFVPGVIDMLRQSLHRQGITFPLDQADLLAQLKAKGYFVPYPSRHGHQQKFEKGAIKNQYCWAIDLDKFSELGLQLVSDEVWLASLHADGDTSRPRIPASDWSDPRRGPLFAIVDALEEKEQS